MSDLNLLETASTSRTNLNRIPNLHEINDSSAENCCGGGRARPRDGIKFWQNFNGEGKGDVYKVINRKVYTFPNNRKNYYSSFEFRGGVPRGAKIELYSSAGGRSYLGRLERPRHEREKAYNFRNSVARKKRFFLRTSQTYVPTSSRYNDEVDSFRVVW